MDGSGPYPTMKDSGVEWLGDVPAHWGCRRLKTLCAMQSGEAITAESIEATGEYPVYGDNGVRGFSSQYTHDGAYALIGRQGALCGNVHLVRGRFWASEHAVVTNLHGNHAPEWFVSILQAMNLNQYSIAAAQPGLSVDRVLNLWAPVPPQCEQRTIARFLNHAMNRIDRYIRAKEKLIALLEEQKRATINEAVTGQIDVGTGRPYPSYRVSELEWLRRVPSHWETRRSKRVFRPRVELARPKDVQLSATQAWGVIAQADFEERIGRKVVRISQHLDKRRHVEIDDFVISMRSFQGGLERAWTSGCIRSSYVVLRATTDISRDFFGFLFKSAGYINALRSTADFIRDGQDLNFDNFCRVDLPFPPLDEQRRIGKALNKRLRAISGVIEMSRQEMALLSEFRQRLVADVITGRLDVRQAASDLLTNESITDRTDVSSSEVDQNSPSTQRGIAMEATS